MKEALNLFVSIALIAVLSCSFAQEAVASDAIPAFKPLIIENTSPPPGYTVDVTLDKAPLGDFTAEYFAGEEARLRVTVSQPSYVYLFSQDVYGNVTMVLPNQRDPNNYIDANQSIYFPPNDATYRFRVAGPAGLERVFAVASTEPLPVTALDTFNYESAFATVKGLEQVDSLVSKLVLELDALPSNDWISDHNAFFVR